MNPMKHNRTGEKCWDIKDNQPIGNTARMSKYSLNNLIYVFKFIPLPKKKNNQQKHSNKKNKTNQKHTKNS